MKYHIKTKYCDEVVSFKWSKYSSGQIALQLNGVQGPMMTVTNNVPDANVPEDCIVIKDYSENEGIRGELIRVGVIKPRAEMGIPSGFVMLHVHKLKFNPFDEQESQIPNPTVNPNRSAPSHGVDKVAKIIAKRDELSYDEAREIVEDCAAELLAISRDEEFSPFEALERMTEQLQCDLGLEPDYIDELVLEQI